MSNPERYPVANLDQRKDPKMAETNFAETQRTWDTNPPLEMCRRKGAEHAAYGWAPNPPGNHHPEQVAAYMDGFNSVPMSQRERQMGVTEDVTSDANLLTPND